MHASCHLPCMRELHQHLPIMQEGHQWKKSSWILNLKRVHHLIKAAPDVVPPAHVIFNATLVSHSMNVTNY